MGLYNAISFSGYKVFPHDRKVTLDNIEKINVIIGKNNSGKSTLIDVIGMAYGGDAKNKENVPTNCEVVMNFEKKYTNDIFDKFTSVEGYKRGDFAEKFENKPIYVDITNHKDFKIERCSLRNNALLRLKSCVKNDFSKNIFLRVSAERDIAPEEVSGLSLKQNGEGATNMIREYLTNSDLPEKIIEETLLSELNKIMMPETEYESIRVQEIADNKGVWEIYLQEKGCERIALSKTGSGLKTIILMLLNLHVVSDLEEYKKKIITYTFEELENNLHPAMQRRVFEYLYEYAKDHDATFFLTTHSHVAINTYYGLDDVAIYHVVKNDGKASVKRIESYLDKTSILDDLDVKASDILQSNGVIWVEGPSDRIYIKRWLEVFTENKYVEGKDYQFLLYGGRILSQYAAQEETDGFINMIKINRNSAIVIDSDKRKSRAKLNNTKNRIIEEFKSLNMFCWVTAGKEIENYLTKEVISSEFGKAVGDCERYGLFPEYIEQEVGYHDFSHKKVEFAKKTTPFIEEGNSKERFDLKDKIKQLYKEICKWNGEFQG